MRFGAIFRSTGFIAAGAAEPGWIPGRCIISRAQTESSGDDLQQRLSEIVLRALEDMKAVDTVTLDVRGRTGITDTMFIASGNSNRHVKAIADNVAEQAKAAGFRPLGMEGQESAEWILVDLGDAVIHVMLPRVRELYRLERIWGLEAPEEADEQHTG
jgi:ribosome-associated protein